MKNIEVRIRIEGQPEIKKFAVMTLEEEEIKQFGGKFIDSFFGSINNEVKKLMGI